MSGKARPDRIPAFFVAGTVCCLLTWVISVHFLFSVDSPTFPVDDLHELIFCTIVFSEAFGVLVIASYLGLRDTIRRRGMFGINFKRVVCPQCGTRLRRGITRPSLKELLWGGWTCHECGLELSRWGRPWKEQNTLAKWAVLCAARDDGENGGKLHAQDERIRDANGQTQHGEPNKGRPTSFRAGEG